MRAVVHVERGVGQGGRRQSQRRHNEQRSQRTTVKSIDHVLHFPLLTLVGVTLTVEEARRARIGRIPYFLNFKPAAASELRSLGMALGPMP
jgi:hypothetical protein